LPAEIPNFAPGAAPERVLPGRGASLRPNPSRAMAGGEPVRVGGRRSAPRLAPPAKRVLSCSPLLAAPGGVGAPGEPRAGPRAPAPRSLGGTPSGASRGATVLLPVPPLLAAGPDLSHRDPGAERAALPQPAGRVPFRGQAHAHPRVLRSRDPGGARAAGHH